MIYLDLNDFSNNQLIKNLTAIIVNNIKFLIILYFIDLFTY